VVSWGESTFIQGGINAINPVDVASFRRPGAELKEGLIPVNMAYANISLSDAVSAEAFYQLGFHETVITGCGTYFSTNDYAPQGCDGIIVGANADGSLKSISRLDDEKPKSSGQYGVALRYVSEELGDTEFGLYAMNIHSRLPLINPVVTAGGANAGGSLGYRVVYPEDMQLAGISFATNVGTMALSGEISLKKNVALQMYDAQLITAGLANAPGGQGPGTVGVMGDKGSAEIDAMAIAAMNATFASGGTQDIDGFIKHDITQAQVTAVKLFDQVGAASRIILIGEAGYTYVHDFISGPGAIRYDTAVKTITESSWGYRARMVTKFTDVFDGVNLTPVVAWNHDVKGFSPNPGGSFKEGRQSMGLTLKADYLSTYNAALSYTQYMKGENNNMDDRDFASITLGMQF